MPLSADHEDELLGMLDAMRENQLPVEDEERLSRWAIDDGDVCRFVVEYFDMCAVLEWKNAPLRSRSFLAAGMGLAPDAKSSTVTAPAPDADATRPKTIPPSAAPADPASQTPPASNPSSSHLPRWLIPSEVWLDAAPVVAFGVLLVAVGAFLGYWASQGDRRRVADPQVAVAPDATRADSTKAGLPPEPRRQRDAAPLQQTLATLISAEGCRLLGTDRRIDAGDRIEAGDRLEFSGAAAELLFDDGARLAIEGPARLEVVAMRQVKLHTGCLVAHVPVRARGFAVNVGLWHVVDIGTEFGVIVDNDGAVEVHVLSGTVDLISTVAGEPPQPAAVRVQTGDARRLSKATAREWTPVRFSVDRFARLLERNSAATAARWRQRAEGGEDRRLEPVGWATRLQETFQQAELDPARWLVVKPGRNDTMRPDAMPADARLADGRLMLDNGCFLCSTDEFNATEHPARVRVQWQVEERGDCLGIILRAGKPTPGVPFGDDLAVEGVRGFIDIHGAGQGPRLVLITQSGGKGTELVQDHTPFDAPLPGETYEYEAVDYGNRLELTARRVVGVRPRREATVAIDVPATNSPHHHVVVHNFVDNNDVRRTTSIQSFTIETQADR